MVDPDAALACYDRALALWRGEAYLDFGDAAFAVTERIRLAELRAYARERRFGGPCGSRGWMRAHPPMPVPGRNGAGKTSGSKEMEGQNESDKWGCLG